MRWCCQPRCFETRAQGPSTTTNPHYDVHQAKTEAGEKQQREGKRLRAHPRGYRSTRAHPTDILAVGVLHMHPCRARSILQPLSPREEYASTMKQNICAQLTRCCLGAAYTKYGEDGVLVMVLVRDSSGPGELAARSTVVVPGPAPRCTEPALSRTRADAACLQCLLTHALGRPDQRLRQPLLTTARHKRAEEGGACWIVCQKPSMK